MKNVREKFYTSFYEKKTQLHQNDLRNPAVAYQLYKKSIGSNPASATFFSLFCNNFYISPFF